MHKLLLTIAISLAFVFRIHAICFTNFCSSAKCGELSNLTFPSSFKFGAATSAYQVEGGWNASGKGVSLWDWYTHDTDVVIDGSTGDVACDSFHKYREDIQMLKDLKVNHYRFSISWTRILPTGFVNNINPEGVAYYNNLIDGLLEAGIEPWVTLYHFDIPESIDHLGGWTQSGIVKAFTQYADLIFSLFGDRVKTWITINEAMGFCVYFIELAAITDPTEPIGISEYICSYYTIKVHASVYRLYERKYKSSQKGRVTMALFMQYYLPGSNSTADIEAAERMLQFQTGIYLHPLIHGNYPPVVIDIVDRYSAIQGFPESRLPKFTPEELVTIKGAIDVIAINHYGSVLTIANNSIVDKNPSQTNDEGVIIYQDPSWGSPAVYPEGFRGVLNWIKDRYNNPEIVVTEQGYPDEGQLNDTGRINYYQSYLSEALKAIHEDKVRLTSYTAWGLMDDFEWYSGYTVKYGLYQVDFDSPNRTRTPKESFYFYRGVIDSRSVV